MNLQGETPMGSPENYDEVDKILSEERKKIEAVLVKKNLFSTCQSFEVSMRDKQVVVNFRIPSTCHIRKLLGYIVKSLGPEEEDCYGSRMILRTCRSSISWELNLSNEEHVINKLGENQGSLSVRLHIPVTSKNTSENTEIEFVKRGSFSSEEVKVVASALRRTSITSEAKIYPAKLPLSSYTNIVDNLEEKGVKVSGFDKTCGRPAAASEGGISWDNVAGYEEQKREIEDTIVLALRSPDVYDTIARGTRAIFEPNRPRAVLFEGPPGTGKTSCARVIANHAGIPLLYVPLEIVGSKWYGESENLLKNIFSRAESLPNGALIFLDEVDSLATVRDSKMNETTRRLLSVLLRQIDGFKEDNNLIIIGATNRKEDLDPALISRFDTIIKFGLPNEETRKKIVYQYAKHLTKSEISQLAVATHKMSGRDIRNVCQQAERQWASKIIRGANNLKLGDLPHIGEYLDCAEALRKVMIEVAAKRPMRWMPLSGLKRQRLV